MPPFPCLGAAERGRVIWIYDTINPGPYSYAERPPGCAYVDHDEKRYFYRVKRSDAGEFRRWLSAAFDEHGKIKGRFPCYRIQSV